ncbi:hypothetical protein [Alloactinosynnema sp. L-07]|nr:hypothetical protein [Alloactinosynnema sp. L-07]
MLTADPSATVGPFNHLLTNIAEKSDTGLRQAAVNDRSDI